MPRLRARQIDHQVERRDAIAKHHDAIGERDGLGHVMGDEHGGEPMLAPDPRKQLVHLRAGQRVKRSERLVE